LWAARVRCGDKHGMFSKVLSRIFLLITSREVLLSLGILLALLSVPMIVEQFRFVRAYAPITSQDTLHEMEGIVDGLAGILVAAGVFMESRDTIRRLALSDTHAAPAHAETDPVEVRLNEVAHQNGMGILLIGLLMEIGTLLIGLPARVIDAKRFERGIFGMCTLLSVLAVVILYDFVKDYLLTYRMKR
jgi:hypothetical protein